MWSGSVVWSSGCGPDGFAGGRVRPLLIVEVLAEQAEFPELIGDVFADVGHRTVRTDDDFGLVVFIGVFFVFGGAAVIPGHDPTAFILAGVDELNRAAGFQLFEGGVPEVEMQDFTFAGE